MKAAPLLEKLYVVRGDIAQLTFLGSDAHRLPQNEWVVSVHANPDVASTRRSEYAVTCTHFEPSYLSTAHIVPTNANSYHLLWEYDEAAALKLRVLREDADLPSGVASELHELWIAALRKTSYRSHSPDVLDANYEEFFASEDQVGPMFGQTVSVSTPSLQMLDRVGHMLLEYCGLPQEKRDGAATRIGAEASAAHQFISAR